MAAFVVLLDSRRRLPIRAEDLEGRASDDQDFPNFERNTTPRLVMYFLRYVRTL